MVTNLLFGSAGQMGDKDKQEFRERVCNDNEEIVAAFKTKRDSYVFTDTRLILEDVQGLMGKKRSLLSIPYTKISAFEVETAGFLDTDGELRFWVTGYPEVIKKEVRSGIDIYVLQNILSRYTR